MPVLPRLKLKQVFENPESYATTLLVAAADLYGTELLTWAPQTVVIELKEDTGATLPTENLDKLMAAIAVITSDEFYKNLAKYIQLCNVLSGDEFDPEVFDPADSAEMAWGMTEAMLLSPPDDAEPFSDEIRFYMGHMLAEEGIISPPDVLGIAIMDNVNDPLNNLSDDPEMYQAFYDNQQSKAQEITDMVKAQVGELIGQLEALPLTAGNTDDLAKKLRENMK
jgi:hypothetical protein